MFRSFVIFAEMRTGSNHLEETLASVPGLMLFGEAFNPLFVGGPKKEELCGLTLAEREKDPFKLLNAMAAEADGALHGFRYFHDHDPRVFDALIADKSCAKIILTRNPAESYVSLKIAQETGQWRLTNFKKAKSAKARFEAPEYFDMLEAHRSFQAKISRALRSTGQTLFPIAYEELGDLEVLNGLLSYLGVEGRLDAIPGRIKRQNPDSLDNKVENWEEMARTLSEAAQFDTAPLPQFEALKGPGVRSYVASSAQKLLFMPMEGGPVSEVARWLEVVETGPLLTGLSQADLRKWASTHQGFRAFTVLRHPLARAYHVFRTSIVPPDIPGFQRIRKVIRQQYGVPLHEARQGNETEAFLAFMRFLKQLQNGQTSLNVPAALTSQTVLIQSFAKLMPPHLILREDELQTALPELSDKAPYVAAPAPEFAFTDEMRKLAMEAYRRDYMAFGFET